VHIERHFHARVLASVPVIIDAMRGATHKGIKLERQARR